MVRVRASASFEEGKNRGRFPIKGEYTQLKWYFKQAQTSPSDPAELFEFKFIQDFRNHNRLKAEAVGEGERWVIKSE